jgi:broad specificity phosphatase PhoE
MPIVYLVRHAISQANIDGVLAGRTPGVGLGDGAHAQLNALRDGFSNKNVNCVVSSPLLRAQLTAEAISMSIKTDHNLDECDYGMWTNRSLSELAKESLWESIQNRPSQVQFPGGESILEMQQRAIQSVEHWRQHCATVALVTHGDVIKSLIAHFCRLPLDSFQGIRVPPASVTKLDFGLGTVRFSGVQYSSRGSEIGGGKNG